MKKYVLALFAFVFTMQITAQELSYYLPANVTYNANVPKPKDIVHHQVGEFHITHDRLVQYMYAVAKANPSRVLIERMGFSTEQREQVLLTISSPNNIKNIDAIRTEHLKLYKGEIANIANMPAIVWIGHSIHGNESSGANAALLGAYYFVAAEGSRIDSMLNNVVILYDPSFNPDGLQRFSTWANQHKSSVLVTDPNSREFSEVWPGGRFNHYWFDLNRDWLPQVHIESQNRVQYFHKWKPNILTDHHEMGSNASFFFQPGVPSRVNSNTPNINQALTAKIATYHTKALDKIKSLYFTKENYDDFYYGKGSTYPDAQGCVGILFEQASSRGHAQQTANGVLTFPFTIRNQFVTELSTVEAAVALRKELLQYQQSFFKNNLTATNSYVYTDDDNEKCNLFTQMLLRNDIKVYADKSNAKNFIVPLAQSQQTLIKAIFEKTLSYKDSIFYDITAWTFPLAYGIQASLTTSPNMGNQITTLPTITYNVQKSNYAYAMQWNSYYAPAALYALLNNKIETKLTHQPFTVVTSNGNISFEPGTILIPLATQQLADDVVFAKLNAIAEKYKVNIHALQTGLSISGVDLGSGSFSNLAKPSIATVVGNGVSALDAGEVWFTLDKRMEIPQTHLDINNINRVNLDKYNTLILVSGNYNELNKEKIKTWVQNGGTLIAMEEAIQYIADAGLANIKFKKIQLPYDSTQRLAYNQLIAINGAQAMSGAIFATQADTTHPLLYGYHSSTVSVFKANKVYMEKTKNPFSTPMYYKANPLQSGWLSMQNKTAMQNTAATNVYSLGSGKIICIDHNPNFRGFWLGGTKLMMNALFFGKSINSTSSGDE